MLNPNRDLHSIITRLAAAPQWRRDLQAWTDAQTRMHEQIQNHFAATKRAAQLRIEDVTTIYNGDRSE